MSKITEVRHVVNEKQNGELARVDRWEYEFTDEAATEEKQAVRAYGCHSPEEFQDAMDWWTAIDNATGFKAFLRSQDTPRARSGRRGP